MIIQFTMSPVGAGESLHEHVAVVLRLVDESGLPYQFTAMSTLVEGEWDEVMGLVRRCHEALRAHHARVVTTVTIDDRQGVRGALTRKVEAVEKTVGKPLRRP